MLLAQVAALALASRKLATDLATLQHHHETAEKSAYTAFRDVHKTIDGVRSEAVCAVSFAR